MMRPALEQVAIASPEDLWTWLDVHHAQEASVLLVTWKKAAGAKYVGREDVLDALIAYGWIDGRRYKHDDSMRTVQLIARRKQQVWAESYKTRAARLDAEGRMKDAGRASVLAAQAAGLWTASEDVDALQVPTDLQQALDQQVGAMAWFATSAPSYRRNVLRWLKSAKRKQTRDTRIAQITERAAKGEKVPQY